MQKQIKLAIITLVTLVLSAILLWQGVDPFFDNLEIDSPAPAPVTENDQVLGEVESSPSARPKKLGSKVTKVVDGDTIEVEVEGSLKKVRYIGINTPETVDPRRGVECFGRQASDENKRLVLGKQVFFEKDVSETDKYGRLLRLVYLPLDDGTTLFVNDYLVREGFAHASTYPPDVKFAEVFKAVRLKRG